MINMDKKIKDYIAEKKLSDDDIFKLLTTVEKKPTDKEVDAKDKEVEDDSTDDSEEEDQEETEEEDGSDEDQPEKPDMAALIKLAVDEALNNMKKGRKAPKTKKSKKKAKTTTEPIWKQFGSL